MRHPLHLLLLLSTLLPAGAFAQSEAAYIRKLAAHLGGRAEVSVNSGRVDILTATHAIEVERANKWKNSIGQALWYGLQTGKRPGIILLVTDNSQFKYLQQLVSSLTYAGLTDHVRVWAYPEDFPTVVVAADERRYSGHSPASRTDYWLTTNSKKRHKKSCRYYEETRGRYCTATEGTPAGCCYR